MAKAVRTPISVALEAYARQASKLGLSNEDFVAMVMEDFGVTAEAARGFLMACTLGRADVWRPGEARVRAAI